VKSEVLRKISKKQRKIRYCYLQIGIIDGPSNGAIFDDFKIIHIYIFKIIFPSLFKMRFFRTFEKIKKYSKQCIAVSINLAFTATEKLTCHMGSHSVTCHLTEVRIPPLPPAEAGFSDPGRMRKAELTYVT